MCVEFCVMLRLTVTPSDRWSSFEWILPPPLPASLVYSTAELPVYALYRRVKKTIFSLHFRFTCMPASTDTGAFSRLLADCDYLPFSKSLLCWIIIIIIIIIIINKHSKTLN